MTEPDFRGLIPHRPPMVLIDALDLWGAEKIRARRVVREGDPFVVDGRMEEAALLECIAQTIAAGDARYALEKGGRVKRGYLTGLTGVRIFGEAKAGEEIRIEADCQKRMDGMGLFSASARTADDRLLAEGIFKLFVEIDYTQPPRPGAL